MRNKLHVKATAVRPALAPVSRRALARTFRRAGARRPRRSRSRPAETSLGVRTPPNAALMKNAPQAACAAKGDFDGGVDLLLHHELRSPRFIRLPAAEERAGCGCERRWSRWVGVALPLALAMAKNHLRDVAKPLRPPRAVDARPIICKPRSSAPHTMRKFAPRQVDPSARQPSRSMRYRINPVRTATAS